MAKQKKEKSFEEILARIEEIINSLNNASLPLQKAIELHAEAAMLIKESEQYLKNISLQFETLQ